MATIGENLNEINVIISIVCNIFTVTIYGRVSTICLLLLFFAIVIENLNFLLQSHWLLNRLPTAHLVTPERIAPDLLIALRSKVTKSSLQGFALGIARLLIFKMC